MQLEVAVFTVEDAILASTSCADRIEVCTDYDVGGLTMPLEGLAAIRKHWRDHRIAIPMYAMIQPAAASFRYEAEVFRMMEAEIRERLALCDGFVFGILTSAEDPGGEVVDEAHCKRLVDVAGGLPCTFHRAVDEVADPVAALDAIAKCGFTQVLSSGGGETALEGSPMLRRMVESHSGVTVMAGGGVRHSNCREIWIQTAVEWLHTAARVNERFSVDEVRTIKNVPRS